MKELHSFELEEIRENAYQKGSILVEAFHNNNANDEMIADAKLWAFDQYDIIDKEALRNAGTLTEVLWHIEQSDPTPSSSEDQE